jgi:hypothetical protein
VCFSLCGAGSSWLLACRPARAWARRSAGQGTISSLVVAHARAAYAQDAVLQLPRRQSSAAQALADFAPAAAQLNAARREHDQLSTRQQARLGWLFVNVLTFTFFARSGSAVCSADRGAARRRSAEL